MGEPLVKRAWWAGPVTCCGRRAGVRTVVLAFLAGAGFRAAARPWVKLDRPQPVAPVRARANELDAGERRPMIGGEERARPGPVAGCWGRGVGWAGSRVGVRGSAEWSHIHPFGRPPGAGAMTVPSGDRAAQSDLRARRGRLRVFFELARGLVPPPGLSPRPRRGAAVVRAWGAGPADHSANDHDLVADDVAGPWLHALPASLRGSRAQAVADHHHRRPPGHFTSCGLGLGFGVGQRRDRRVAAQLG